MAKILVRQATLLLPYHSQTSRIDIAIDQGKVISIKESISGFDADTIIDAQNYWITPKFFDLCQRPYLKQPQGPTLAKELMAAQQCGFGHICLPPDSGMINDRPEITSKHFSDSPNNIQVYPIGALTSELKGEQLCDLTSLMHAGCFAVSQSFYNIKDLCFLRQAYQYAASFDIPIIIYPQDPWFSRGQVHEGTIATMLGILGEPDISEAIAISQHLQLIEDTDIKAHFTCISSKKGLDLVRQGKQNGLPISCDVAISNLFLDENSLLNFDTNYHVKPPFRSNEDKLALRQGLVDGTIDNICSNHCPLQPLDKQTPFGGSVAGLSCIDAFLGLGIMLMEDGVITPLQWVKLCCSTEANVIRPNQDVSNFRTTEDFNLIDPKYNYFLSTEKLTSQGYNNPYIGWNLRGKLIDLKSLLIAAQ